MKKVVACIIACAMILAIGCSNDDSTEDVFITTATSLTSDPNLDNQYEDMLVAFQEKYKHIFVTDTTQIADDAWKSHIRAQFTAKKEADVTFFFSGADAKNFIESGDVVSLDTIRAVYPNYCSNIREDALESMREYDGKIYAVPVMGFWEGLFCNQELFKTYNVPMITDWDSLLYAIEVFNKNGITPIAASFQDIPNYWIENSILSAGGLSSHSVTPTSPEEVPPEWAEGLRTITDLYDVGAFAEDSIESKHGLAVDMYYKQKAAMILEGSWLGFPEEIEKITRVVKFPSADGIPKDDQAVIAGFGIGFYISTEAWNDPLKRDACVKYVEYMTSDESIQNLCVQDAPASNITISKEDNYVRQDGVNLCKEYKMQPPIDSRLNKSAWEYLISKTSEIVSSQVSPEEVLNKAMSLE